MNEEELPEVLEEEAPEEAPPPEEFPFVVYPPEITFATREVQPPGASYVSPCDALRVEIRNAISGLTVHLHARLLKPSGELVQGLYSYTPTADRALNTYTHGLAEGCLIALVVDAPANAKPGGCYARVLLVRGAAPVIPLSQVLVSGYVVTGSGLKWPYPRYVGPSEGPGRLRVIIGTNPAPGNAVVEYVPTGARWRLLGLEVTFTTDATAVDRYVRLALGSNGASAFRTSPTIAQPASQMWIYDWAIGVTRAAGPLGAYVQDALPDHFALPAGWWISVYPYGIQPGDDFGAPNLYVEEWIEP